MSKNKKKHSWPVNCLWPEPIWDGDGPFWDWDMAQIQELDEDGQELIEIGEYMDELVSDGRLDSDYQLNEDYEEDYEASAFCEDDGDEADDSLDDDDEREFAPEIGEDYWDEGFDRNAWEEDLSHHINLLKIDICDTDRDPVIAVREVIGYSFINENLLRQAFTRRAFGVEYGVGDSEVLEFYGDSVLNTIVSRELYQNFADSDRDRVEGPFRSRYTEGELSRMKARFVSRDHLAARAAELGLDKYILYGTGETPGDAAREDMMEALIGAVAVDSDWDWSLLADVVDRLIHLQLEHVEEYMKESCYDRLNRWHQKHFGCMPEYIVDRNRCTPGVETYDCTLKYLVPKNDKGIWTAQNIHVQQMPTRSAGREYVAKKAITFLQTNGLWINLSDAGIEPRQEDAINQLQELFQKKYVEKPEYYFEERGIPGAEWYCTCICSGVEGWGTASSKTKAKKNAAFMVLRHLMMGQ